MEILHYLTASGRAPYQEWLDKLKDLIGRVAIQRRVDCVAEGNLGDHKPLQKRACTNYALIWDLAIACIMQWRVGRSCCSCVVASNGPKNPTSSARHGIGVITNGGDNDETETKSCPILQSRSCHHREFSQRPGLCGRVPECRPGRW